MSLQVDVGLLTSLPGRYASAYFQIYLEKEDRWQIHDDFGRLLALYHQCAPLANVLISGHFSKIQKLALWEELSSSLVLSQDLCSFVKVLIDGNRIHLLPDIGDIYGQLFLAHKGVVSVKIETSAFLTQEQKNELEKSISRRYKAQIEAQYISHPALLAGMQIQRGCEVIDMSLSSQLRRLTVNIEGDV